MTQVTIETKFCDSLSHISLANMAQRNLGLRAGVLIHFGFLIFKRQGTFYPNRYCTCPENHMKAGASFTIGEETTRRGKELRVLLRRSTFIDKDRYRVVTGSGMNVANSCLEQFRC